MTSPDNEEALEAYRHANALLNEGRPADAIALFDQLVARHPQFPQAHVGRGLALAAIGAADAAVLAVARAVKLDPPGASQMLVYLGYQFLQSGRPGAAEAAFSRLLLEQPQHLEARQGRIMALIGLGQFENALPLLASLRAASPAIDYLPGLHLHAQLQCCDWSDYDSSVAAIAEGVRRGLKVDTPHTFLGHSNSPALQRLCAEIYVADRCAPDGPPVTRSAAPAQPKLKVGYLSSDFRDHAVAQLLVSVVKAHDKERFETYAFSSGSNDGSDLRQRLMACFDHFIDVASWSDQAIAKRMAELGIHAAVDLGGHSAGGRTRVFAYRPAPLQISFLGYPGTLGTTYVDYLIADSIVVPPEQREHYTEQLILMPDSFLPTADAAAMAPVPTRAAARLPEDGIVFCCFNAPHKISPALYEVWMAVLKSVPGSVLWLRYSSDTATNNLRAEARLREVDPDRLVFATRAPTRAEHYARFSLADVFLDTSPYNAHTTAAEALQLAVPVITCKGSTFASRVAASLLDACGLPELAAETLADYKSLAIELARDSSRLAGLKERLRAAQSYSALFDPVRYCRQLETAVDMAWSRRERGDPVATFKVERS